MKCNTIKGDFMSAVDQAIQDRVSYCGIADQDMPLFATGT
jgi:hypothetical protein